MNERPTHASVTDVACTCKYLQRAADDPSIPIVFDKRTNEYQYVYQRSGEDGPSNLIIYHCPFCGGAAPASKRHLLFHVIPLVEADRLAELLAPLRTVRDAIERLGVPDHDDPIGEVRRQDETDESPSSITPYRTLTYESLSDVAQVRITERRDGSIDWSLQGKYIGDTANGG